ncbi:MAG: DUF177 domain-containing protein [Bacteroidales bacterium]|nr:DUF177 domain-containing protein [Bacteroidales bacterium]
MEKNNEFLIPVSGLALGSHSYQFEINDDFFAEREYSEIQKGNVSVRLTIDRQETLMTLHFGINGAVCVPCDRCADEFDLSISDEREFFLKLGTENAEESDDVEAIPADQANYDVSSLVYEYIILAIPMHRVHPDGQCNPEVMAMLTTEGSNEITEEEKEIDPRWAALKGIKLENNQITDK